MTADWLGVGLFLCLPINPCSKAYFVIPGGSRLYQRTTASLNRNRCDVIRLAARMIRAGYREI